MFVDETTERLWIAHLDGRPSERLAVCERGGCDYPSWSPDGRKIAYSRVESADGVIGPESVGIEVLDRATGSVSQVIRLHRPLLADVPRWSPDGTQLVIQVERMDDEAFETGAALAIVPVAGGEPRYVTDFDAFASSPDWGWASEELAFSTELVEAQGPRAVVDDTWDLWRVRPDGTGLRRISHQPPGGRLKGPRWIAGGTQLTAYDLIAGGGILVDATSGDVRPFLTTGIEPGRPHGRGYATGSVTSP